MICFMSDHPEEYLPSRILDTIINNAQLIPMISDKKIYMMIKDLFKCINEGSPPSYPHNIFGYDPRLFHEDPLIDNIDLPDTLFTKKYRLNGIELEGIYGFRKIDFYYEISPHILGRLFEHSLNDQEEIIRKISQEGMSIIDTFNLQQELGVVYTREVLTILLNRC